jgi:hypothetical protein
MIKMVNNNKMSKRGFKEVIITEFNLKRRSSARRSRRK